MKVVLLSRDIMRHQTRNMANSIEISEEGLLEPLSNGICLLTCELAVTTTCVEVKELFYIPNSFDLVII